MKQIDINCIVNNGIIKGNIQYLKKVDEILKRYNSKNIKVGILGEFSSGKSTLINALLGSDILNHATVETTATITNIYNRLNNKIKVVIRFSNGKSLEKDSYKDILMYTTTKGNKVTNYIDGVDIYTPLSNSKFKSDLYKNLVLIDTPGLNGIADKHREITVEEIKNAHCCIYVLQKNGLSQWDREFLPYIFNYQNNFIFVQNFIDEIKRSEGETVEKKLSCINDILSKIVSESNKSINFKLVGISALKALCGRDRSIKKLYHNDLVELDDKSRIKLISDSNIEELENSIINLLSCEEQNKVKERVTVHSLKVLLNEIVEKELYYLNEEKMRIVESEGYKDIKKAERDVKLLFDNRDNIINKLYILLEGEFFKYKKILYKQLENEINKINDLLTDKILSVKHYDDFIVKEKSGYYINILNTEIKALNDVVIENEEIIIQEIHRNILSRLSSYTGYEINKKINISKKSLKVFKREIKTLVFTDKKNEIILKKNEYQKAQYELENALATNIEISKDYKYEHDKYIVDGIRKKKLLINLENSIKALGKRPTGEEVNEEVIRIRDKRDGVFGILLGTRIVNKVVPCFTNKSKCEWEKNKREIDIRYFKDIKTIEKEMLELKNKVNIIEENLMRNNYIIERNKEKVNFLREQILVKEEELKVYETKAKGDYLKLKKKELISGIEGFLFGDNSKNEIGVINALKDSIESDFINNKLILEKNVSDECYKIINKECERIHGIISGCSSAEKLKQILAGKENEINQLINTLKILEVIYSE